MNKIYGCVVSRDDHIRRKDDGGFDPEEYELHPELYYSTFAKNVSFCFIDEYYLLQKFAIANYLKFAFALLSVTCIKLIIFFKYLNLFVLIFYI